MIEWPAVDELHIGTTGSREAPLVPQVRTLHDVLGTTPYGDTVLHHGCCLGWDATAHYAALSARLRVVLHPPEDETHMCTTLRITSRCTWRLSASYHDRDQDIVDDSQILIASPLFPEHHPKSKRSGTWLTIRMARRKKIPIWHITRAGFLVPDLP